MSAPTRRQVLRGAGAGVAAVAAGLSLHWAAGSAPVRRVSPGESPFALGLASGDPLPEAVVIWTRLAADETGAPPPGVPGAPDEAGVAVAWEVALDEGFARVVRRGTTTTRAGDAHSVHVDVDGLVPDTAYHYRFQALGQISPAGRTRTLPAAGSAVGSFSMAVSSCQKYSDGYYVAYRRLVEDDVAVMLWLGDYVYADATPKGGVRGEPALPSGEQFPTGLEDYRAIYAGYKADPDLRAAHAALPWIVTWDDHEVSDNYAGVYPGPNLAARITESEFLRLRTAAYRAWWEHMPVRPRCDAALLARDPAAEYRIFRRFDVGTLMRICVLDTRQYRTGIPAGGAAAGLASAGEDNEAGDMLGEAQERWLLDQLTASPATWNAVAQQVMMSPTRFGPVVNLDQWDGFVPQRRRLLSEIAGRGVPNPVVLSGDIHTTWANVLSPAYASVSGPSDAVAVGSPDLLAAELVAPPLTSAPPLGFFSAATVSNLLGNPAVRYFDGEGRGYLRCEVTPTTWRAVPVVCDSPESATAPVREGPALVVGAGSPEIRVEG